MREEDQASTAVKLAFILWPSPTLLSLKPTTVGAPHPASRLAVLRNTARGANDPGNSCSTHERPYLPPSSYYVMARQVASPGAGPAGGGAHPGATLHLHQLTARRPQEATSPRRGRRCAWPRAHPHPHSPPTAPLNPRCRLSRGRGRTTTNAITTTATITAIPSATPTTHPIRTGFRTLTLRIALRSALLLVLALARRRTCTHERSMMRSMMRSIHLPIAHLTPGIYPPIRIVTADIHRLVPAPVLTFTLTPIPAPTPPPTPTTVPPSALAFLQRWRWRSRSPSCSTWTPAEGETGRPYGTSGMETAE